MKVSVIVAVYKDIEALRLIVNALKKQTYTNFELVIAEDNNSQDMKQYIQSIEGLSVKHTYQEDTGIRKARSLNNGILASSGNYLIFIDGDCIPYSTFIESHVSLSENGRVLTGRRVNLGETISQKIRTSSINCYDIEKKYFQYYKSLQEDEASHLEQGIWINPKGWIYNYFFKNRQKSNIALLGCNYSCFREDIIGIQGYDEGYGETAVADDTDIQWRFEAYGLSMKSCKFAANVFHLHHSRSFRNIDSTDALKRMSERKVKGLYKASIGLDTHDSIF